jgi:hypothetical protein
VSLVAWTKSGKDVVCGLEGRHAITIHATLGLQRLRATLLVSNPNPSQCFERDPERFDEATQMYLRATGQTEHNQIPLRH